MKTKVIFFFLLISFALTSQETCLVQSFYLTIENETDIPEISAISNSNTLKIIHRETYINDVFSKYDIYKFEKAFPNFSTPSLQKVYTVSVNSKSLINEIKATISAAIFKVDRAFEGFELTKSQQDFFNSNTFIATKSIFTSDTSQCVFDCNLEVLPNDFNISIKTSYDVEKQLLIIENSTETSCGNNFKLGFKGMLKEDSYILWETSTTKNCFNQTINTNCQKEANFYEMILLDDGENGLILEFDKENNSFKMKKGNGIFGETVFLFESKTASLNDFSKKIKVFKNPETNFLEIQHNTIQIKSIEIFNVLGSKVKQQNYSENFIDVSNLKKGLYFIVLETDKGVISKKIIF